ncbi:baseplate J/gp47 family protein [Roseateles sp. DB2]|uniref:baseplate J/gp47 family protein n=1 Tax=Roseateles sp. DB2 TaxID=3453717 RepID=UPI003EEE9890
MYTGSQQDTRLSPALLPGHFRPDELSLAQRLRQLLQWARQLDFVTLRGMPQGRWSDLLEQDLSLLLAELSALPVAQWQAQAQQLDTLPLAQQRRQCLALAQALNRWHSRLLACLDEPGVPADDPLHAVARLLQDRLSGVLAPQLRGLLMPEETSRSWHPHWGLQLSQGDTPPRPAGLREHRLLWLSMCRVLAGLQSAAQKSLPGSLRSQRHEPSIGLLLAQTQLLQRSREPLDCFNERLTQHYYAQRLGLGREAEVPALVHLLLERQPHARRPVQLPAGSRFVASQDGVSRSVESLHELWLSPLKVSHLLSLYQPRDPDISPERDYGYATNTLSWQGESPAADSLADVDPKARPPLGGGGDSTPARQGLALASPLLQLCEGQRRVQLHVHLRVPDGFADGGPLPSAAACRLLAQRERQEGWHPPGDAPEAGQWQQLLQRLEQECPSLQGAPWLQYLLVRCLHAQHPETLTPWLGRLFAVWLCATTAELSMDALTLLRRHAEQVLVDYVPEPGQRVDVDDPLSLLYSDAPLERSLVFDRVFRGAWSASLSCAEGWLTVEEVFAIHGSLSHCAPGARAPRTPRQGDQQGQGRAPSSAGFLLCLQLGSDQAAICAARPAVHGSDWPALPVLQLRLQSRSRLFASSLLQQLSMDTLQLEVQVQGLRALELHNQLGRLDPSKPFLPFGPLPEPGSYLMFSHPELAQKPLQSLQLHLHWQGLPRRSWDEHYAGYPDSPWSSQALRLQASVLADGQWRETPDEGLPLFGEAPRNRPLADQTLDFDGTPLLRLHRPAASHAREYSLLTRCGYFRLSLSGSPHAFGHADYPPLLTATLTLNSKLKQAAPLPQVPYTPTLAAVEADYVARQRIPARSGEPMADGTELRYLCPFGTQVLHALPQSDPRTVLQRWPATGQLMIGLQGEPPQGTLSLLFKLRSESAREPLGRPLPRLRWQAWCGDGWLDLEAHRVLLDGTEGLLRTGVILLDLPSGMSADCPSLPPGPFWLRLLGDERLPLLAGLQGVWTNGVLARLQGPALPRPLAPLSVRAAQEAVPGLAAVRQPWPSFAERAAETQQAWITRIAERLRHRGRAAMPWDYERLVLQHYPEVQRVKCIPRSDPRGDGRLTVVVVPALPAGVAPDGAEAPKLDAATLARIQRWLQSRMPPGQPLLVRNATYERLQVRCSLRLKPGEPAGERLRQINDALRAYLSPWREGGPTMHFDWQLQVDEVEALLRAQPGVAQIGQASLLHIIRDDQGHYTLRDTAVGSRLIRPSRPWSLALPTRGHLLELSDHPSPHAPASGIAKLTLGGSFIIGQDSA